MSNPFVFQPETFEGYSQETLDCGCAHPRKLSMQAELEYPGQSAPAYTQCDFIDARIDVSAQYALYDMVKGGGASRNASLQMLAAVKSGRLGGIYQQDQLVPAKRAQALGIGWWQLIPQGQNAICVTQPKSQSPIIAIRKSIASNRSVVAQALEAAWKTCGIPNPPAVPPSGKPCPQKPLPPPPPPKDGSQWAQCNRIEYDRLSRECIAESERCLRQASEDVGVAVAECLGNPVCTAFAAGKYLLALKRCKEALQRCDQAAKNATGCKD